MFKLAKYDLKGCFKDFIIMVSTIIILNLALLTRINVWSSDAIFFLSLLIGGVASVVVLIWNVTIFSRDLYEDTSYLVFTTPKSGKNILMNKVVTAIIQCLIVSIIVGIFTVILLQILKLTQNFMALDITALRQFINAFTPQFWVLAILSVLVVYITFLLTIYLSITLGRVAIKNRKFGKLGAFGIFILLSLVQVKLEDIFLNIFPQTFNLKVKNVNNIFIDVLPSGIDLNISLIVLSIIIIVAMFYAIAYLIENKLDL
ncbi:hypothetical protein [Clostridium kluyveri]|uniref:Uncharacterized protein n=1 Tax=Clostridium kluyveri TaxID=1534 RepID=A0A1L5F9H1_CLOKL|nr:hypothetical protein [Clostridium kluyveri]APM39632.1 hypothetical protein BS101_13220 [Clostridium kluyveri]